MKPVFFKNNVCLPPSAKGLRLLSFSFFPFLLLLMAAVSFSGKATAAGNDGKAALNWKADATVNNVTFYHVVSDCNGRKVVLLKFVNKNTSAMTVSWKETVKTQMRPAENAFRGEQRLTLPPGETLVQDCSSISCKACVLTPEQVNPTYLAQILDYSFKDIKVTR